MPYPGRSFAAFLFDMDGTLIDSIASAIRAWRGWAEGHGLDAETVLAQMHGVRAVETIRRFGPAGIDAQAEADLLTQAEMDDVDGIVPISGAADFLAALPVGSWAIVTSAPRRLALRRLESAGLPPPPVLITADDVAHGKPAPDCFLAAARALEVDPHDCLVWEDAPAGIAAAEAAGAAVMVITATHSHPYAGTHPTTEGYGDLTVTVDGDGRLHLG